MARAQPARPALSLPAFRLPSARALAVLAGIAAALALGYAAARETSLFALEDVRVSGGSGQVEQDVRSSLRDLAGTSLVKVDAGAVERRLEELPSVVSASVDRAFPHTLQVAVRAERPVAVVRYKADAWTVSARGRVIRGENRASLPDLPRIWLASAGGLSPGATLRDPRGTVPLAALRDLPERFPLRVLAARSDEGRVVLVLSGQVELRLGAPDHVTEKLAAASAVLRTLSSDARRGLEYLDVSLPERPVGKAKSQLEG